MFAYVIVVDFIRCLFYLYKDSALAREKKDKLKKQRQATDQANPKTKIRETNACVHNKEEVLEEKCTSMSSFLRSYVWHQKAQFMKMVRFITNKR